MSEIMVPGAPTSIPAGYQSQSLSGGLPTITLASDVANADILEFTGALTVQDITVVIPPPLFPQQVVGINSFSGRTARGWMKILRNSTTGPFAVKVIGPGGQGVTLPQGEGGCWCWSKDGFNVVSLCDPPGMIGEVCVPHQASYVTVAHRNVYRTPIGNYFAANPAQITVTLAGQVLVYGTDYLPYYNGYFNVPQFKQPVTVQDVASGIVLLKPVNPGLVLDLGWMTCTLPVAPRLLSIARFEQVNNVWDLDTTQRWITAATSPGGLVNGVIVAAPPPGYVVEFWRMTRHQGGLRNAGKFISQGRKYLPFWRGPQLGVAQPHYVVFTATTIGGAHLGGPSAGHRKFKVCYYNPTTMTRSLFNEATVVLQTEANPDRHNNANQTLVRQANALWLE